DLSFQDAPGHPGQSTSKLNQPILGDSSDPGPIQFDCATHSLTTPPVAGVDSQALPSATLDPSAGHSPFGTLDAVEGGATGCPSQPFPDSNAVYCPEVYLCDTGGGPHGRTHPDF